MNKFDGQSSHLNKDNQQSNLDSNRYMKKSEKERLERRAINKVLQKDLTKSISQAYQTIRPTMIQAQRLLKIIDNLYQKFDISKYLDYDFIKHFESTERLKSSGMNLSEVNSLSSVVKDYLKKISKVQNEMHEILEKDVLLVSEIGEEEEEHSRNDDEDGEDKEQSNNELNEKEEEEKRIREQKVNELKYKMDNDYKNLVRHLERSEKDMLIIKVESYLSTGFKQEWQPTRTIQ